MKYYLAIKNKLLIHITAWMNRRIILLRGKKSRLPPPIKKEYILYGFILQHSRKNKQTYDYRKAGSGWQGRVSGVSRKERQKTGTRKILAASITFWTILHLLDISCFLSMWPSFVCFVALLLIWKRPPFLLLTPRCDVTTLSTRFFLSHTYNKFKNYTASKERVYLTCFI